MLNLDDNPAWNRVLAPNIFFDTILLTQNPGSRDAI